VCLPFVTNTLIKKGDSYTDIRNGESRSKERLTSTSGDGDRRLLAGEGDLEREPEYERGILANVS
jgi:hypothetical protein